MSSYPSSLSPCSACSSRASHSPGRFLPGWRDGTLPAGRAASRSRSSASPRARPVSPLFVSVYLNERAQQNLNAAIGDILTMFYGTTNQTIVNGQVTDFVQDMGKANWNLQPIVLMAIRTSQERVSDPGRVNLIRISNDGGVAEGGGPS